MKTIHKKIDLRNLREMFLVMRNRFKSEKERAIFRDERTANCFIGMTSTHRVELGIFGVWSQRRNRLDFEQF